MAYKAKDRLINRVGEHEVVSIPDLPDQYIPKENWGIESNTSSKTQTTHTAPATTNQPAATVAAGGTPAQAQNTGFSFADYTPSDAVIQAQAMLNEQLAQKPGEYKSAWQAQLDDVINKILNREKFSYDLNGDALYQQYKDKHNQQGKMAMMDTMGQAQAMTGGYGNSYAQSVGQQAYQAHLQQLNDIVPELYKMAYDKYNQEGQDLYNKYSMLGAQEQQDYGRYRDSVGDWNTERDYLTGRYDSERDYDYGKYTDERNFGYGSYIDDRNYQYQKEQDALAEAWRQKEFNYQVEQDKIAADMALQQLQASLNGGTDDGGNGFQKATFSRVDENGNYVFYIDGKERTYAPGVNPYTGTKNSNTKYGTFDNGYQPDNINGRKLSKTGITDEVNGVTQNVWQTPDGKKWIWDATKNQYLEYDDGSKKTESWRSNGRDQIAVKN